MTHIQSNFQIDLPNGDMDHGRFLKGGVEACRFPNHLFPEWQQVLAQILWKEGIFFSISLIMYYHVYLQQYGKYLKVNLIGSKATNRKQEKLLFWPWLGIEPSTFQSWVFCLVIWAITPRQSFNMSFHFYICE